MSERPSQNSNPVVCAVTLNWNRFDDTVECIASLKKNSFPPSRIVLLDQASPDGSGRKLAEFYGSDEQIIVVRNPTNSGFAEGSNIGIRRAIELAADEIFLVNNDTVVAEDCIQLLSEALASDPSAAAAGPVITYYSKPEKIWQAGGSFSKVRMAVVGRAQGKYISQIENSVTRTMFLTGCAILLRRSTIERVGLFDASYFFYGEDVDYGLRIGDAGMNMCVVPAARVYHKIGDIATERTSPFVVKNLARSTVITIRKRFSGLLMWYGVTLQFTLFTLFRTWQILRGGNGWDSIVAWFSGLSAGLRVRIRRDEDLRPH